MKVFTWEKQTPALGTVYPVSREGESLTFLPQINSILMFGGIGGDRSNEVFLYDLLSKKWKEIKATGAQPTPRCYFAYFFHDPYLFIHAGQGDKGRSLTDFYMLNTQTWVWKRLFMVDIPCARHYHAITNGVNPMERILFGGVNMPDNILLNDTWMLNFSNLAFKSTLSEIPGAVWTQLKTKGEIPTPRKGHAAIYLPGSKSIIIFGGASSITTEDVFQIHTLSLTELIWKKLHVKSDCPSPRAYFSISPVSPGNYLIFGGLFNNTTNFTKEAFFLDTVELHWSQPFLAGEPPSARYNHGCCCFDIGEPTMMILGGIDTCYCSMDIYFLRSKTVTHEQKWEQVMHRSDRDKMISEIASNFIFDSKKYITHLNDLIMYENLQHTKLTAELKAAEEEYQKMTTNYNTTIDEHTNKLKQLEETDKNVLDCIQNLCILLKHEEALEEVYQKKNHLMEENFKNIQTYMVALDHLYSSLQKNKYDERDAKSNSLRRTLLESEENIDKARVTYRENLLTMVKNYEFLAANQKTLFNDIEAKKSEILALDSAFKTILDEEEDDEQETSQGN